MMHLSFDLACEISATSGKRFSAVVMTLIHILRVKLVLQARKKTEKKQQPYMAKSSEYYYLFNKKEKKLSYKIK